ncbi:MAG: DUF2141 domain-containing protein [Chlorobiaceae bacterium]|nr:DUF2141 domain-containing protein [Chlorobiaceae bacterium]
MKIKHSIPSVLLLCQLFTPTAGRAEEAPVGSIEVSIGNVRSIDGVVGVALFKTKKGFPDKNAEALAGRSIPSGNPCVVVFDNLPYGTYAVSVMHDENGNGKMDKGFFGIPKEGFGSSNNPKVKMGPPSFDDSKFDLNDQKLSLTIDIKYLRQPEKKKE